MGHALAPGVFQRFSDTIIRHVFSVLQVRGVAYLDDWLFYQESAEELLRVPEYISHQGITVNEEKRVLRPTKTLTYLGFHIDTSHHTIKLTLPAYDRLKFLLRHTARGSDKGRQRIAGYASWVLFNLRGTSSLEMPPGSYERSQNPQALPHPGRTDVCESLL